MRIIHRPAVLADVDLLMLYMESFYAMFGYAINAAVTRVNVEHFITDPSLGYMEVIEAEGQAAGYIVVAFGYSFEFGGRIAVIDEFYITPEFRYQGIGRFILESVIDELASKGIHAVRLEVEETNQAALKLYGDCDFITHKRFLMTRWL